MRPGGRAAGSGRDHPRHACSAAALGRPLAATSHLTVKETEAEVCTVEVTAGTESKRADGTSKRVPGVCGAVLGPADLTPPGNDVGSRVPHLGEGSSKWHVQTERPG